MKDSGAFVWAVLCLALFAAFFELGRMDVTSDNEGQRATPPAEMLDSGNYVVPTINGNTYLAKPPLLYWAIAGVYAATGSISAFTARIPSAACFVALVVCIYAVARRHAGADPARWAALACVASPYVLQRSRVAELDIPLTLATFLAIVAFRGALDARSARRTALMTLLAGIALSAGILLKGPVPFLFLYAAWLAHLALEGGQSEALLRPAIRWTAAAFCIGIALWLLGLAAPRAVPFPVALIMMAGAWTTLACASARGRLGRSFLVLACTAALGIAGAAPWAAAVLHREGWPLISTLLRSEVLDRTHTATAINSGHPLYYAVGLLGMLAPWSFLFPTHASRRLWQTAPPLYRFSLLTGWQSVLLFSLIAGKEYEYILPATPFLLIATGFALANLAPRPGTASVPVEPWVDRWSRRWLKVTPAVLAVLAIGGLVYVAAVQRETALTVEALALASAATGLFLYSVRQPSRRVHCTFDMALCVFLVGLLSQSYHYTGVNSPKTIARATGALLRSGYDVEAVKMTAAFDVFPGFAFYTRERVPMATDADAIRRKLHGEHPYYCVVRKSLLEQATPPLGPDEAQVLMGPFTRKKLLMVGNRPLPSLEEPAAGT